MTITKKDNKHNGISLFIHVVLVIGLIVLRLDTMTSDGKDRLLKSLPSWFKENILQEVGNAYSKGTFK